MSANLVKMNIYEEGGHFGSHLDTPRSETHFGSLVVCLPSYHQGGELKVTHAGVRQDSTPPFPHMSHPVSPICQNVIRFSRCTIRSTGGARSRSCRAMNGRRITRRGATRFQTTFSPYVAPRFAHLSEIDSLFEVRRARKDGALGGILRGCQASGADRRKRRDPPHLISLRSQRKLSKIREFIFPLSATSAQSSKRRIGADPPAGKAPENQNPGLVF